MTSTMKIATLLITGSFFSVIACTACTVSKNDVVDCSDLDNQQIFYRWRHVEKIQDRRKVLNCIVGHKWDGDSLSYFDIEQSLIVGMDINQALVKLGEPDKKKENYLRYNLGAKETSVIDNALNTGWPERTRSLNVEFDSETQLLDKLYISGQ